MRRDAQPMLPVLRVSRLPTALEPSAPWRSSAIITAVGCIQRERSEMEIGRLIGIVALAAAALSVIFEFLVPSSARIIDAAALVFAVATWTVPALIYALIPKAKTSLAAVGRVIGMVVQAACLSAIALWLALVTLVFAPAQHWAWPAILTVVAFWILGAVLLGVGSVVRRRQENARSRS
jgi:hypothetical protein